MASATVFVLLLVSCLQLEFKTSNSDTLMLLEMLNTLPMPQATPLKSALMIVPSFASCSMIALVVLLEDLIVFGALTLKLALNPDLFPPLALVPTITQLCALAITTMLIVPSALPILIAVGVATMTPLEDAALVTLEVQLMARLALSRGCTINALVALALLDVFVELAFVANVNAPLASLVLIAILPLVVMGFQDLVLCTMFVVFAKVTELLALAATELLMVLSMILVVCVEEMDKLVLIFALTADVHLALSTNIANGVDLLISVSRERKLVLLVPLLYLQINAVLP